MRLIVNVLFIGKSYSGVWKELPKDWLEGLNIGKQVHLLNYFIYCYLRLFRDQHV